jgi:hypothetical protein
MYQKDINRILLINNYLTKCRKEKSNLTFRAQKYLTYYIGKSLNKDKVSFPSLNSFLFLFLFR